MPASMKGGRAKKLVKWEEAWCENKTRCGRGGPGHKVQTIPAKTKQWHDIKIYCPMYFFMGKAKQAETACKPGLGSQASNAWVLRCAMPSWIQNSLYFIVLCEHPCSLHLYCLALSSSFIRGQIASNLFSRQRHKVYWYCMSSNNLLSSKLIVVLQIRQKLRSCVDIFSCGLSSLWAVLLNWGFSLMTELRDALFFCALEENIVTVGVEC